MESEFYNWDDLEVGRYDLNHSERFFEQKHQKHEKLLSEFPDLILTMEDKENNQNPLNCNSNISTKKENKEHHLKSGNEKASSDKKVKKIPPNLVAQPFNIAKSKCNAKAAAAAPTVYKYAEVYERKKQAAIERVLDEEKKNRIFHSRPAPKFAASHEQKKKSHSVESVTSKLTIPMTPVVLKKSKEMEERRNQMLEEYKRLNRPQKFVSRKAHVLHEEPFIPKKTSQVVEPQPFNLHVEKRLGERKQFDDHIRKSSEEKKKQEEEERRRREELLVRELRKLTSFKARPNPFK